MTSPYKALINDDLELELSPDEELDLVGSGKNSFHIIRDHKTYRAKVVNANFAEKKIEVEINGNVYSVQLQNQHDQLIKELGFSMIQEQKIDAVNAPMPGLVLSIMVDQGQEVNAGDPLFILEAMKMENVIKSPGEGTVAEIPVKPGQAVEKGQMLLRLQ